MRTLRTRPTKPSLYVLESLVTYRLTRIADTLLRAAAHVYRARYGVTLTEVRILATLGRHQALSVNEASRLTGIDKAWVSRSVVALVRRKLVKRDAHHSDSRLVLLSLTPQGKTKVEEMVPLAASRHEHLLAGLTKRERAIFNGMLDRIQAQADQLLARPFRTF